MTERHVCSLALSRKLAAAGFPDTDTMFVWADMLDLQMDDWFPRVMLRSSGKWLPDDFICSAPLLSEIMESMPAQRFQTECALPDQWFAKHDFDGGAIFHATTGPDAAALLWLALRGEK